MLFVIFFTPATLNAQERPQRQVKIEVFESAEEAPPFMPRAIIYPRLPGFEQPMTQDFLKRYTTRGNLEWIASCLKRGEPYLSFIRGEIKKRGMPAELLYLPLIESGFNIKAHSRSGARGLWQFMQNSVRPYMKIDDWLDERLDFWKSTNAALTKLQENYNTFGNWELALAAYNSGAGAVSKAINTTGIKDYWALCAAKKLKAESIYYVPKLLAVYFIASNPRLFDLDIFTPAKEYKWVKIKLDKQVNIEVLAEYAGIDKSIFHAANTELNYSVTPPGANYELKIPAEHEEAVREVLERDDIKFMRNYVYKIQTGDTLSALASYYGVSVDSILDLNPALQPRFLKPGTSVLIPAYKDVPPYSGAAKSEGAPAAKSAWSGTYTVRSGDTLWSISRRFGVKPEELAERNKISMTSVLSIGKVIAVP